MTKRRSSVSEDLFPYRAGFREYGAPKYEFTVDRIQSGYRKRSMCKRTAKSVSIDFFLHCYVLSCVLYRLKDLSTAMNLVLVKIPLKLLR